MKTRLFDRQKDLLVTEVGLGCWQLGGSDWGDVDDHQALTILNTAVDHGIRFLDTADVYGTGRSESLIGRFLPGRREDLFIASKVGRSADLYPDKYSQAVVRAGVEDSLRRLGVEALDLIQTHCVPTDLMRDGAIFDWLETLRVEGKVRYWGASVETMEEALICLDYEGLASLQIIFNIFRQKPINALFERALEQGVALIIRLPLASGLLAGKFTTATRFAANDHRQFNRDGQKFNVGETFAGLPFDTGVGLADALQAWVPEGMTMAQFAQRWILDHPAVTTVITGASKVEQVVDNAAVSDLAPLTPQVHQQLADFYRLQVGDHIRGPY